MKMCIITAHAGAESLERATKSWVGEGYAWEPAPEECERIEIPDLDLYIEKGTEGMLPAYQRGFERSAYYDILAYLHDDTIINDPGWVAKVMREFEDPTVGLVGFGGATRHGDPFMYNKPYEYQQLARVGFASNMRDAENHGERFTGSRDVAVLDGFALIVRREVLEKSVTEFLGEVPQDGSHNLCKEIGWPIHSPIGYVCYDYWLSCMTRRLGYRIRLVGVACDHLGGQTFVKLGMGRDEKHWKQYVDSHRYIYDEFKDVLPYEVPR